MRLSDIIAYLKNNRWIIFLVCIAVLILCAQIITHVYSRSVSTSWQAYQREIDSSLAVSIQKEFQDLLSIPLEVSQKLVTDTLLTNQTALQLYNPVHRQRIISLFKNSDISGDVSIALHDTNGSLLAYHNREVQTDNTLFHNLEQKYSVKVLSNKLYTYLTILSRFYSQNDSAIALVLLTAVPFEVSIPLHNRFLQSTGFTKEIKRKLGVEIILDFDSSSTLQNDGRYVHSDLIGPDNLFTGRAYFLKTNPVLHLRFIEALSNRIISFLYLVGFIIASIHYLKKYFIHSTKFFIAKAFLVTLCLWTVRYLLLLLNISTSILSEDLFDPMYFASPFGFGIVHSLGELLITSVFLLINVSFLWKLNVDSEKHDQSSHLFSPYKIPVGVVASFLIFLLVISVRGYAATISSFVFDSSFNFDDIASIFQQPMYVIMLICVFFVTASFIIGWILLLRIIQRLLQIVTSSKSYQFVILAGSSFAALSILFLTTQELLYPKIIYITITFLIITIISNRNSILFIVKQRSVFLNACLLSGISLIAFLPTLQLSTNEKRLENAALLTSEYTQPIDGWSNLLISQTLSKIESDFTIADKIAASEEEDASIAFYTWAQSPLSGEPNNSSISLYDYRGELKSLFTIGIPQSIARYDETSPSMISDTTITYHYYSTDVRKARQYYVGIVSIRNQKREKVGTAIITLEVGNKIQFAASRTDIIRNTTSPLNIVPDDEFIISEFINDTLSSSTNPEISRRTSLPQSVHTHVTKSPIGIWDNLQLFDTSLPTFFAPLNYSENKKVIAITLPPVEFRFILYRNFRFGIFFFISSIIFFSIILHRRIYVLIIHRQFSFGLKLRIGFVAVAIIPIIILWGSSREFSKEQMQHNLSRQLANGLTSLELNIFSYLDGPLHPDSIRKQLSTQVCKEISDITGSELNIYVGSTLACTSKPELYFTNLLNPRLNENAYSEIFLGDKDFYITSETVGEFSYLIGYKALRDESGRTVAAISTPTLFEHNILEKEYIRATSNIFLWSFIVLFIVLAVGFIISNQIAKPVYMLTRATRDISSGDLTRTISTHRHDEIGDLISSFNSMTQHLAQSKIELARAERELAWKEMAKQVAHEIRNPLTPMKLAAQHLLKAYRDGSENIGKLIEQVTATIIEQIEVLAKISTEFSHFARMPHRHLELIHINDVIDETTAIFRHHTNVQFEMRFSEKLPSIIADRNELQRCFINILRNAIQSIQTDGNIIISSENRRNDIQVTIQDNGVGINPSLLPKIFEPNFSTKTEGMGLGLSIVKKILDDLGATIDITSQQGTGTMVVIQFPIQQSNESIPL